MTTARERLRSSVEHRLLHAWFDTCSGATDPLVRLLRPLSLLTGAVARRRRTRIRHLDTTDRPAVVVVGNLVVGGAGKTPLTIALAHALSARGLRVGLLAGGYRARRSDARMIDAHADPDIDGDEPVLLAQATGLPVAAGRRRSEALAVLCDRHPGLDVVLSDDGLQHAGLARSVELVVFDARGAGNGLLLPAGPLREPLHHIDSMDALVMNGDAPAPRAHRRVFRFAIEATELRRLDGAQRCSPAEFARQSGQARIAALAGIAQPARFFTTLRGIVPQFDTQALGDHAQITPATLAALDADIIVMTEKDAVKCAAFADRRCWALAVCARLDPALPIWLEEHLNGPSPA